MSHSSSQSLPDLVRALRSHRVIFAVVFVLTAPFDRRRVALHLYSSAWATFYVAINPMWKLHVTGREHLPWRGPAVIAANHLVALLGQVERHAAPAYMVREGDAGGIWDFNNAQGSGQVSFWWKPSYYPDLSGKVQLLWDMSRFHTPCGNDVHVCGTSVPETMTIDLSCLSTTTTSEPAPRRVSINFRRSPRTRPPSVSGSPR